jgi:Glutathione S-transferase, N-terminal domain
VASCSEAARNGKSNGAGTGRPGTRPSRPRRRFAHDRRRTLPSPRGSGEWLKIAPHPCWKVQKALDEGGIDYELVKGPVRRSKRDELERLSGQRIYPVIEFEDGRVYRAESKDMAARIGAGQLFIETCAGARVGSRQRVPGSMSVAAVV